MPVYKRRDTRSDGSTRERWQIRFTLTLPDGSAQRVRKTCPDGYTQKDARRLENELRAKATMGTQAETAEVPTLRAFADRWMREHVKPNLKFATWYMNRSQLQVHLLPELGDACLDQIRSQDAAALVVALRAKGLGPKSVNHVSKLLVNILRTAERWGAVPPGTLTWKTPLLRVPQGQPKYLTEAEVERLYALKVSDMRDELLLALNTGLRRSEISGLQWQDIDFERSVLVVARNLYRGHLDTPKSGRSREVPLTPDVVDVLHARLAKADPDVPWLFHNNGQPRAGHDERRMMRHARHETGIERLHYHLLRHTFASRLATRGVSMRVIQKLLGHANVATTERYAHLLPGATEAAVALLARPPQPLARPAEAAEEVPS